MLGNFTTKTLRVLSNNVRIYFRYNNLGIYKMDTIHYLCKKFRERVLQKTLQNLSDESGIKLTTISAFENGRSNNVNHLAIYYNACDSDIQRITFMKNLEYTMGAIDNGN